MQEGDLEIEVALHIMKLNTVEELRHLLRENADLVKRKFLPAPRSGGKKGWRRLLARLGYEEYTQVRSISTKPKPSV